jgi:hypothetical protein
MVWPGSRTGIGALSIVLALALMGCDDGAPSVDAGPDAGCPGEATKPSGLPPDLPCPPGKIPSAGGGCEGAGVPKDGCAQGFEADDQNGCRAKLPADPCMAGTMAVPGDTMCHEVAPCGSDADGPYAGIQVEPNTQFVDQAYAGGGSTGSVMHPWTTIQQGINAAAKGAIVAVAAGSYAENLLIAGKSVRLWGRCPALVEVKGLAPMGATILVEHHPANLTEIRGLGITGAWTGVAVPDSLNVTLDQVWVHDLGHRGIDVEDGPGPTSVVVTGSLVEATHDRGVFVVASMLTVEGSVIRGTLPSMDPETGRGVDAIDDGPKRRANLIIRGSVIEQNHDHGVAIAGSDGKIEATVIRDTQSNAAGDSGEGVGIEDDHTHDEASTVAIRGCVIERNRRHGVGVAGSTATIERTVVRGTQPDDNGHFGRGLGVEPDPYNKKPGEVTVNACLIDDNRQIGVAVFGSKATLTATRVRGTKPDSQMMFGRGLVVQNDPAHALRGNIDVTDCVIEENTEVSALVVASDATIRTTAVRSTNVDAQGMIGRGVAIQYDPLPDGSKVAASAKLDRCLIVGNTDIGVAVSGSPVTIIDSEVRQTAARPDGHFGDGIAVVEAAVNLQGVLVSDAARAAVSNFGGTVVMTGSTLGYCQYAMDGESVDGLSFSFDNSSQNRCNAMASTDAELVCTDFDHCNNSAAGLTPPSDVDPAPQGP